MRLVAGGWGGKLDGGNFSAEIGFKCTEVGGA